MESTLDSLRNRFGRLPPLVRTALNDQNFLSFNSDIIDVGTYEELYERVTDYRTTMDQIAQQSRAPRYAAISNSVQSRINNAREALMPSDSTTYQLSNSEEDLADFLEDLQTYVDANPRGIVVQSGDFYYTINQANRVEILTLLRRCIEEGCDYDQLFGSDAELIRLMLTTLFRLRQVSHIQNPQRQSRDNSGQFFPYTHGFESNPELTELLRSLGCLTSVDVEYHKDNCLVHALIESGIPAPTVEELKHTLITRAVKTLKLKLIADKYNISFILHVDGSKNLRRVIPKKLHDEPPTVVELGMFKKHYFKWIERTGCHGWGIRNHNPDDPTFQAHNWHKRKSRTQTGGLTQSINSMRLLKLLVEYDKLKPINRSNHDVFSTSYYENCHDDFDSLEYPAEAVKLRHPPRHKPSLDEERVDRKQVMDSIDKARARVVEKQTRSADGCKYRVSDEITRLGYGLDEQLQAWNRADKGTHPIVFFDYETSTDGEKHKAYMVSWLHDEDYRNDIDYNEQTDSVKCFCATGSSCTIVMLEHLCQTYGDPKGGDVTMVAHNATYDLCMLTPMLTDLNLIERGVNVICGSGVFTMDDLKLTLHFKDSLKMINGSLSSFASRFQLQDLCVKEVLPYELYTTNFVQNEAGVVSDEDLFDKHPDLYEAMLVNLEKWGCRTNKRTLAGSVPMWDMLKYSEQYCKQDTRLLSLGYNIFRQKTLQHMGMDINEYVTISSLADSYVAKQGCYEGVYSVAGTPQSFFRKCSVGGRVMCADNLKQHAKGNIGDLDARSLYASAIQRIVSDQGGYPIGPPKVWHPEVDLQSVNYYYVQIKVLKVEGPDWRFPMACVKEDLGNNWTNDLQCRTMYLDKNHLQNLVKYSALEYQVLKGYYFDEGCNSKIGDVIQHLYDERVRLKSVKDCGEQSIKLVLNSIYGYCGRKPIIDQQRYVAVKDLDKFICNNYAWIKQLVLMPNGSVRVSLYKTIAEDYNCSHISCMILSTSKTIMNEVLCTAQQLGIETYYTDTDSMHMNMDRLKELQDKFREDRGFEMIGNSMGQFHNDFEPSMYRKESDGVLRALTGTDQIPDISSADEGIWVSKKAYALSTLNSEVSGEKADLHHCRLKGIPQKSLIATCNTSYQGRPELLYEDLLNGVQVPFELTSFKVSNDHTVSTQQMKRRCSFAGDPPSKRCRN